MEFAQAGLIGYCVHVEHILKGSKQYQKQKPLTNSKSYQRCYIHFQAEPLFLWFNLSHPGSVNSDDVLLATDKFQSWVAWPLHEVDIYLWAVTHVHVAALVVVKPGFLGMITCWQ